MVKNSKYRLQSICVWKKKERKAYINFKFAGEIKGGQNNKVLKKIKKPEKA